MKKTLSIIALLLCVAMLASCTARFSLDKTALEPSQTADEAAPDAGEAPAAEAPASAPDAEEPGPAPESAPADTAETELQEASAPDAMEEGPAPGDIPVEEAPSYTGLSAADCVADAEGAAGQLPRITLDCPGADSINEDIEGTFRYLVDADYCKLYYEVYVNGDILSLLVGQQYTEGGSFFTPYNLDLATGERMSGQELMDYLGIERTIVGDNELAAMAEEFEHMYGGMAEGDSAEFYQEQYDRTVSTDNAEFGRLWLGFGGTLYFVAKLYSLEGAEFYEYPMSTGLVY